MPKEKSPIQTHVRVKVAMDLHQELETSLEYTDSDTDNSLEIKDPLEQEYIWGDTANKRFEMEFLNMTVAIL